MKKYKGFLLFYQLEQQALCSKFQAFFSIYCKSSLPFKHFSFMIPQFNYILFFIKYRFLESYFILFYLLFYFVFIYFCYLPAGVSQVCQRVTYYCDDSSSLSFAKDNETVELFRVEQLSSQYIRNLAYCQVVTVLAYLQENVG